MFRTSLETLVETTKELPVEIIIIDNGGSAHMSGFIQGLMEGGAAITTYIRNKENMHFGYARNQGLACATGHYVCIADNDINYHIGWLEACHKVLKKYPEKKLWATPIQYPEMADRYDVGKLDVDGEDYRLNYRAGSNCWVMRRKDFDEVGPFYAHRVAGSKWNDKATRLGFVAAVTPEDMVDDLGFRLGYNLKQPTAIKKTLANGEEVYFNQDEFIKHNPDLPYYERD